MRDLDDGAVVLAKLGGGAQLSLARDGRTATYAIMQDEGHVITASDVVVVDLDGFTAQQAPRATHWPTGRIERAPGVSDVRPDGSRVLSFVVGDGDVVVATLVSGWR